MSVDKAIQLCDSCDSVMRLAKPSADVRLYCLSYGEIEMFRGTNIRTMQIVINIWVRNLNPFAKE